MILSSHGIIGSSIGQFDPDAQAFFNRVTAGGGTLSNTEKAAVNTLVLQMKDDGIWSKMKAIYPMVGASAAACAQNLKSSSFTGVFSNGGTFTSGGFNGGGAAFMNTNITPINDLSQNSVHIAQYFQTYTPNTRINMGCADSGLLNSLYVIWNYTNEGIITRINQSSDTFPPLTGLPKGLGIISRNAANQSKYYIRNTTSFTSTSASSGLSSSFIAIGGRNIGGTVSVLSSSLNAFISIGDALNDNDAENLNTNVEQFETTLGRQAV